jgi:hypothetical protein
MSSPREPMRGWSARPACRRDRFFRNDLRDVFAPRVAFDSWQPKIFDATPSREGGRLLDDLGAFHHLESMCTGLAPSAFIDRSSVHASPFYEAPFRGKELALAESERPRLFLPHPAAWLRLFQAVPSFGGAPFGAPLRRFLVDFLEGVEVAS